MSTPIEPAAAGAREAARQDNGQFGTQLRAEAGDVELATPGGNQILTDAWTGQQYVVDPDPSLAMSQRIERARDHWFDHMAVYDLLETVENSWDDDFESDEAVFAVIDDDRDDDGDKCSLVTFYDAKGAALGEVAQAGYTINGVPTHFRADNAPGEAGRLGAVDMAKIRDFDWEALGSEYANQLRAAADEFDRARAAVKYAAYEARAAVAQQSATDDGETYCARCGSPSDAPDPTCSACPESERVACYAGNCTYIAADDEDLDRHVSEDCEYRGDVTDEEN